MPDPTTTHDASHRLTYSEYLKVPELLSLQGCRVPDAHDEMQFIVVHQVYELWFRLVLHTLDHIGGLVRDGQDTSLREATRLCRRVEAIFGVLVPQIHVLESMRPIDFMAFRAELNPASGFQSVQFREVECLLGLKDEVLAGYARTDPRYAVLQERLAAPSLADMLYDQLRAQGFDVTAPITVGDDDGRTEAQRHATLQALRGIYEHPVEQATLYDLCEALVEIDELIVLWRRHHVMMVERQIGDKPGTGAGTTGNLDGIRYLQTTLGRRAFPDLWNVRTVLQD